METKFGERPNAEASSPHSEAVANELRELSLQPAPSPPPLTRRGSVLQLKLQQRRTREDLVNQGIMPPLKSSGAFHEQRVNFERAKTEDYLKRKIKSRPERSELIRMHILEETSAEPSLQATQLLLKKARLADDLNDKLSQRPGPLELVHKNILPVHSSIKHAIGEIETTFPKAPGENWSCDEDSSDSLSGGQESPLGSGPLPSPSESRGPSPTQVPPVSSPSLKLNNETTPSAQRMAGTSQIKSKPNSCQRHKKPKENKPKIKKLKYHQYIPPDQKGDKEPLPHLDSSYAKILQQQQLFLQLQILSQQQKQHYNYHSILPAPATPPKNQQPPSSSSSPLRPLAPIPPAAPGLQTAGCCQSGTKLVPLPPNLDEMKVVELKSQLKLRGLPVSGTKTDLIERLKTHQEVNGGGDTTSSPTAGGTTGAGRSSQTNNNNNNTSKQQQRPLTSPLGNAAPAPIATPSLTFSDHLPVDTSSPEDHGFNNDALGEVLMSPLPQSSLQPVNIKEERPRSTPASCQFSLKSGPRQKSCPISSYIACAPAAPAPIIDKDKMLREKDEQIEELTRMLWQNQRLVEVLRMQLEQRARGARGSEPVRVKQEPCDPPAPAVKQEATEAHEDSCEKQIQPHTKPKQKQEVQQRAVRLAQQQAIEKQRRIQTCDARVLEDPQQSLHRLSQQRRRKSHKQQQKQLLQQPTQLKQQILMKQQKLQQPPPPPPQTQMHGKQLQIQQQQQVQQQAPQSSHKDVAEPSSSAPSFPPLLRSGSTPALVTDSNGNDFLITLTNHLAENQKLDAPEGKAASPITLQRLQSAPAELPDRNRARLLNADTQSQQRQLNTKTQTRGLQVSVDQPQHGAAQCSSAPVSLQPYFNDQERNCSSPSSPTEAGSSLDVLFSPLTPASVRTAASSPNKNDTEHEDDFIDIILQTGETSTPITPAPALSLDRLSHHSSPSSSSSLPPSPLQLLLSPPAPADREPPRPAPSAHRELQLLSDSGGGGRLEDFLESTTGKPLLGVEPGGLSTLIDELHSQMLCTPSILDKPPSPMDVFDMAAEEVPGLDSMDWLDLTMGGEEGPPLAPLGPQTPTSVFSTDFLDSCDLQIQWDSCL